MKKRKSPLLNAGIALSIMLAVTICLHNHWNKQDMPSTITGYIYWGGYASHNERIQENTPSVHAWDLSSKKQIDLGWHGYVLQGPCDGDVHAVSLEAGETDAFQILKLEGGQAVVDRTVYLPESARSVIGLWGEWLYYTFFESVSSYGIRRVDGSGTEETYDLTPYFKAQDISPQDRMTGSFIRKNDSFVPNMLVFISQDGTLAFSKKTIIMPEYPTEEDMGEEWLELRLIRPNGYTVKQSWADNEGARLDAGENTVWFKDYGKCMGWLSDHELILQGYQGNMPVSGLPEAAKDQSGSHYAIYVYDLNEDQVRAWASEDGEQFRIVTSDCGIYPNADHSYVVYKAYHSTWEGDNDAPLVILSLATGKELKSVEVETARLHSYNAFQFGR